MTTSLCALPSLTPIHRGRIPAGSCRHDHVDDLHRQSGRNASPSGITPSTIMSPTRSNPGSRTEIRLGAARTPPEPPNAPTGPQSPEQTNHSNQTQRLTEGTCTDKEPSSHASSRPLRDARSEAKAHTVALCS
jgi:hypothetical protein